MTRITTLDLSPFYRTSLGMDRVLDRLVQQMDSVNSQNYPPYNIIKTGEDTVEVQLAVAGFSMGEIEVSVQENSLTITGEKIENFDEEPEYIYRGISGRKFIRSFPKDQYVEVVSASIKNGILTIKLERVVPENKKPKSIAITYEN